MTSSEQLLDINVDLIEPNVLQPRTNFNEEQLNSLAQSITSNGIIQPLLVRPIGGGRYQLIAGERRWRAAQRANLKSIPAVVRDVPEDKILELALIENIQRQELNPIEEAQAYKRLIETLGLTQEMVAQRVGRDRTFITNYLRLLRLPEDIQNLLEQEKISMGHARALLGVDDPEIQRKVANNIVSQNLSVREVERTIRRIISGGSISVTPQPRQTRNDANTRAAESKLRRRLGTQIKIAHNQTGEGGKIEIEFYSENDLQRIYQMLIGADEG